MKNYLLLFLIGFLYVSSVLSEPCDLNTKVKWKTISLADFNSKYSQIINELNDAISLARKSADNFKELAEKYFEEKEFPIVKRCAFLEAAQYPVATLNGASVRILIESNNELLAKKSDKPLENIADLLNKANKDGYFTLFKFVPSKQLCNIQKEGLDSLFGGQGGASEVSKEHNYLRKIWDRGRMFFSYHAPSKSMQGVFTQKGIETTLLEIKIPVSEAIPLNLSYFYSADMFIAGTKINPKFISIIKDEYNKDQKSIGINTFECPTYSENTSIDKPSVTETKAVPEGKHLSRITYKNKNIEISLFSRMDNKPLLTKQDKEFIENLSKNFDKKYIEEQKNQLNKLLESNKTSTRINCIKSNLEKGIISVVYAPGDFMALENALKKNGFIKISEVFSNSPDKNINYMDEPVIVYTCEKN